MLMEIGINNRVTYAGFIAMALLAVIVLPPIFPVPASYAATLISPEDARKVLPYAKLSKAIYDDMSEGKECHAVDEWICLEQTRAPIRKMITVPQSSAAPLDLEMVPDYTKLNPKIRGLEQGRISLRQFEDAQPKTVRPKESPRAYTTVRDPIGFHAAAYRKGDVIAIVYEGTTFTSIKDWAANLGQVAVNPKQYQAALSFARKIMKDPKYSGKMFVVTGHSLGGGLAQYVAIQEGLEAHVFNPAGLWGPTAKTIELSNQTSMNITSYVGRGNWNGECRIRDVVSKTGVQFSQNILDVPIELESCPSGILLGTGPTKLWYEAKMAEVISEIHKMENMWKSLEALSTRYQQVASPGGKDKVGKHTAKKSFQAGLATALIIDRSGSMIGYTNSPAGTVVRSSNKSDLEKLKKAKEASKAYILSQSDHDMVSISTFSDSGNTEMSIAPVGSIKGQLDEILAEIEAAGGTNISAGLEQGYSQLNNAPPSAKKIAVLLSDGENNIGDWRSSVEQFKRNGWPICTIGFGADADERTLRGIADETGCTYEYADTVDIVSKYQALSAYAEGKSAVLSIYDALAPEGKATYPFYVSKLAKMINVFSSWQGSKLSVQLTDPDGKIITDESVTQGNGRYEEGDTFQMMQLESPSPGKWIITTRWAVPPSETERVNLLVAEKSEVFGRIHGFRPQYSVGEAVIIKVDAHEMIGNKKVPLASASVSVRVQKPGPKMIRMIQAQSTTWTMYKEVALDITRDVSLLDDGGSGDYRAGDGIFGGPYTETDLNGAYLVTAVIKGKKRNRQAIEKTLTSSFQVGPITQNQVTNSQTMQYMEDARFHLDNTTPYSDEILQSPSKRIEEMQGNPLENIEKMLN